MGIAIVLGISLSLLLVQTVNAAPSDVCEKTNGKNPHCPRDVTIDTPSRGQIAVNVNTDNDICCIN